MTLNRAKDYNRNSRDEIKVKAGDKLLEEEEEDIKREYRRNRYHNMSEEDKERLKEYQKIIVGLDKQHNFHICIFFFTIKN